MLGWSSECSSDCESGWTLYFEEQSMVTLPFLHPPPPSTPPQYNDNEEEEDDNEDMSMVSDASSGPPHLHHPILIQQEEEDPTFNNADGFKTQAHHRHSSSTNSLKCSISKNAPRHHPQYSFLDEDDDTATSPIFPNLLVHDGITPAFQHQFAVFQHPDPLIPSSTPQLHPHYNQWF